MEEHSIYIARADGVIGRLDVQELDDEWDVWSSIKKHWPRAYELIDPFNILGVDADIYDRDVDTVFDYGEDSDLCEWLDCIRATVRDSNGDPMTAFEDAADNRDRTIIRAIDWATATIEESGADTAAVQVTITIGDEEIWNWQDAIREAGE